ncbi:hypothetical protein TNCT_6571 [Trichonephila clavata]|uniref:Uncharacterized protein n=1 Tax=Trichonephila clavata TaxID=2740835 RepID=A0A8X6FK31_TRICU|nr:hypothetical protein TNCT_6571 [Trichonephila clavata]
MIPTGTSTKVNQFPINSCQGDSYNPPQSIDKFETRGRTPCLHTCHQISAQLTCVRPLYMTVFRENMIPTGTSTKVNQFPINSCQGDSYIHRNQLTSSKLEVEPMFTYLSSNLSTVNMRQTLVHDSF